MLHGSAPSGSTERRLMASRGQSSPLRASRSSRRDRAPARQAPPRSPSASRRRASSATSPRTPSTTTPRTSRRCSRSRSPSSRRSCATRRVIDEKQLDTDIVSVGVTCTSRTRSRASRRSSRSSAPPRPTRPRASSRTSRRSAALIGHKRGDDVTVRGPPRPEHEAEDHQDRSRLAAAVARASRPRGRVPRPTSPRARRAAREARAPARAGHRSVPARVPGSRARSPRSTPPTTTSRPGEETDAARTASPAA